MCHCHRHGHCHCCHSHSLYGYRWCSCCRAYVSAGWHRCAPPMWHAHPVVPVTSGTPFQPSGVGTAISHAAAVM